MDKEDLLKLIKTVEKVWDSEEYQKRRKRMDRYFRYYCGDYWADDNDEDNKESKIFANLIFSTITTIAPMLTDNKPIWSIVTDYPEFQPLADVYRAAGEAFWQIEEMDDKFFAVVLDALIFGFGVAQMSFDADRSVTGETVCDIIDPRTYYQAPGFEDNWDAPFCGTKTKRSLWWIRKMFPDAEEVKPESEDDEQGSSGRGIFRGKADHEYMGESATVFVHWMLDDTMEELPTEEEGEKTKRPKYPNGRLMVFTKSGVLLSDKPYPYNHGKPPWVILKDYIIPHRFDGMGEPQQIEGLVLEYNLMLRKMAKHVRLFFDRDIYIPMGSGIDAEQYKQDLLGKGPHVYGVNSAEQIPLEKTMSPADSTTLQMVNGLPTVIQDVSGVTDVSKGMAGKKQRQSAHEISALLETSYTRTRQRVRNAESFLKRLFTLFVEIAQQFYNEPRSFANKDRDGNTDYYTLDNSKEFAETLKPSAGRPIEKINEEPDEEYDMQVRQWEDYDELMKKISDETSVSYKFRIEIETNSTLPMDQQSLANLGIQLAQLGHIDTLSLLELLKVPNAKQIVERLKADAAERAGAGGPPGADAPPPSAVMGGMNG